MSTINSRLNAIRKEKGLTLAAFGARIGYEQSTVSKIERGKHPYENRVDDRYILAVSREYNVSETWIRTGKGQKMISTKSDEDEIRVRWLRTLYDQLDEEEKRRILAFAITLVNDVDPDLLREIMQKID